MEVDFDKLVEIKIWEYVAMTHVQHVMAQNQINVLLVFGLYY